MLPPMGPRPGGNNDLWSLFIAIFTRSNAREAAKLLASGIAIEGGRRVFSWMSDRVVPHPTVVLNFSQGDSAYDWIMLMLTQDNVWRRSLNFSVSAASTKRRWTVSDHFRVGLGATQEVDYVPNWDRAHLFRWRGHWIDVVRSGSTGAPYNPGMGMWGPGGPAPSGLKLTFFTMNMDAAATFVEEARVRYHKSNEARVTVHLSDSTAVMHGPGGPIHWGNVKSKQRRDRSTLALEPGVMDTLLDDVREFLDIEDWYTELGIPHHRGYLLHGPPGTGKTSTIYALAGELGLEIYSLSLSAGHIDDVFLQQLVTAAPRGSIVLVEDIDCAFASRDEDEEETGNGMGFGAMTAVPMPWGRRGVRNAIRSRVTLSGLLNVIDGVGSDDGRLFFATTNHYDRLDPALVRPGRIDMKIEYKRANPAQARALFERFFPADRFAPPGIPSVALPPSKELIPSLTTSSPSEPTAVVPKARYPYKGTLSRALPDLADAFARAVPVDEFSPAELQGYLLLCKWDPERAVDGFPAWIDEEREQRRLKAEREEQRQARKAATAAKAAAEVSPGRDAMFGAMGAPAWGPPLSAPNVVPPTPPAATVVSSAVVPPTPAAEP